MPLDPQSAPQFWRHYDPKRGPFYQFWMGIRFFWSGWGLLRRSFKLQITSVIPILLSGGVLAGLAWLSFRVTRDLLGLIPSDLPVWVYSTAQTFSAVLVLAVTTIFLFFPVVTVISIPFREALAAQTERLLTGRSSEVSLPIWRLILEVIHVVFFQIFILVMLLSLNWFLPGIGSILSVIFLIFLAALDMVDPPLGQRGYLLPQKIAFVGQRQLLMAGFGGMAFLLLAIPIVNLLILPVASIGGAVLVLGVLGQAAESDPAQFEERGEIKSNQG